MINEEFDKEMKQTPEADEYVQGSGSDIEVSEDKAGANKASDAEDIPAADTEGTADAAESSFTAADGTEDSCETSGTEGGAGTEQEAAENAEDGSDAAAGQAEGEAAGESGEATEAETDTGADAKSDVKKDRKDIQIEELTDRYRRLFAEFDNFRKRTEAEKAGMFAQGEKTVLLKVLPLIDNFERALATIPEDDKGSAFAEGIEKIYRSFTDQLKAFGVEPIEAVNQPFDANYHNAVMHVEDDDLPENTVVEEFQKGYMFNGKVLRYSMVKVAN